LGSTAGKQTSARALQSLGLKPGGQFAESTWERFTDKDYEYSAGGAIKPGWGIFEVPTCSVINSPMRLFLFSASF
jgi:hypothetical protein